MGKEKKEKKEKLKKEEKKERKAKFNADLLLRLQACLMFPENSRCAECPEPNPAMASLLIPPPVAHTSIFGATTTGKPDKKEKKEKKKEGQWKIKRRMMGVFVCRKCASYHMELGKQVCEVKNIKLAGDWTEDNVTAMELSGNQVVNAVYESSMDVAEKEKVNAHNDPRVEQNARCAFVTTKYQDLDFFSEEQYKMYWKSRDNPRKYGTIMSFVQMAEQENRAKRKGAQGPQTISRISSDPNVFSMDDSSKGETSPTPAPAAQLQSVAGSGYGKADNVDYTNPACLADLGIIGAKGQEDLGYGEAPPDSGDIAQQVARRLVRPNRRGSIQRRASLGGPGPAMARPKSAGHLLDLDKGGSAHTSRLSSRFSSLRRKKDGLDAGASTHSRRSMRTTRVSDLERAGTNHSRRSTRIGRTIAPISGDEDEKSPVRVPRRRASLSIRVGPGEQTTTPSKPRRQRRGSFAGGSSSGTGDEAGLLVAVHLRDVDASIDSAVKKIPPRTRSGRRPTKSPTKYDGDAAKGGSSKPRPKTTHSIEKDENGIDSGKDGVQRPSSRSLRTRLDSDDKAAEGIQGDKTTRYRRRSTKSVTDLVNEDGAKEVSKSTRSRSRSRLELDAESKETDHKKSESGRRKEGEKSKHKRQSPKRSVLSSDSESKSSPIHRSSNEKDDSDGKNKPKRQSSKKRMAEKGDSVGKQEEPGGYRKKYQGGLLGGLGTPAATPDKVEVKDKSESAGKEAEPEAYKKKYQGGLGNLAAAPDKVEGEDKSESASSESGDQKDYRKKYQGGLGIGVTPKVEDKDNDESESASSQGGDKRDYKAKYQAGGFAKLSIPSAADLGYGDVTSTPTDNKMENKATPSAEDLGYGDDAETRPQKGLNIPPRQMSQPSSVDGILHWSASIAKPEKESDLDKGGTSHKPKRRGSVSSGAAAHGAGSLGKGSSHAPRRTIRRLSVSHDGSGAPTKKEESGSLDKASSNCSKPRRTRRRSVSHGDVDDEAPSKEGFGSREKSEEGSKEPSRRMGGRSSRSGPVEKAKERGSVVKDSKEKCLGAGGADTSPRLASPVA